MSLQRALTTYRNRRNNDKASSDGQDGSILPRSTTTKKTATRLKISAPIQLIHTTNMLSYNAPDLPRATRSNSLSARSDDDSDSHTTVSTPPTSPDVAKNEPPSPEPNHLTSYFKQPSKTMTVSEEAPPVIPKRSPSHTKKNSFEALARSRSVSRLSRDSDMSCSRTVNSFSRSPSTSTRASSVSHTSSLSSKQVVPSTPAYSPSPSPVPAPATQSRQSSESHPFGQELASVNELAEEFISGSRLATIDEEQQYLDSRGLVKLSADDYKGAIQSISYTFFPELNRSMPMGAMWI
ncbi:hypothetical protein HIM_04027 [Hirsutella minnesotensis 3608]|uniref:Uncharacterized protein n=1 Tax=Hirsutella minnesotensis 3608 TaxID=1043627 RepID=A0A0F7ZLU8_9HYPO|nr:hypothetical protein HIM_04027 [Hirsutella minnesotensis 3608]